MGVQLDAGLNIADVQEVIGSAIGGVNVTQTVEGLERYPVNIRYPQSYRNSPEQLSLLPIVTASGERIALGDVASVFIEDGPPGIKSENSRINGWVYIDIDGVDIGGYVEEAMQAVDEQLDLPAGYSINWSGEYEYMLRARERLTYVVPLTFAAIIVLLIINFRQIAPVLMLMGTMPLALAGSFWLLYGMSFNFSIAVGVGLIALAGVAVELGVIMLVYLNRCSKGVLDTNPAADQPPAHDTLFDAVLHGASLRVRPVLMTAGSTIIGLFPIMLGTGTGSEVLSRLAAPMVGNGQRRADNAACAPGGVLSVEQKNVRSSGAILNLRLPLPVMFLQRLIRRSRSAPFTTRATLSRREEMLNWKRPQSRHGLFAE